MELGYRAAVRNGGSRISSNAGIYSWTGSQFMT